MEELNQIESVILHYLQGGISEEEMRQLLIWFAESKDNQQLFFELKNIYELRKGGSYPGKEEIAQSLRRLTTKMNVSGSIKEQYPKIQPANHVIGFYKYAAVAVIFVFLTLGIQRWFREDKHTSYTELNVESGPRMSRLTLPDGTKVVLNASTKFKFPDSFDGDVREVFLDGEAFFDVAHNEKIPFVVHTDKQKISVLGTSFNVMDYSADHYAITTLISGSVKIQPVTEMEEPGKPGKVYILHEHQQAFFDKTTSEIELANVKIDTTRTWVNKTYHFRDRPLLEITQRLEKFYGIKIHIADDALKKVEYTGTFLTDQDIESILRIINFDKQFSYTIENDIITIKSQQPTKTKLPMGSQKEP